LRLAQGHEARLRSAIAKSVAHLRELVGVFPAPHTVNAASWSTDPYIRAFFASADDIGTALSRSTDLRAFFEQAPGQSEAYAVLGMEMNERRTLGVARDGELTRSDVPQTTVSFSDHQVRICGASDDELKQEVVRRMVDELALEALAQIAADTSRRDVLDQERALLATRLRMLERQGTGMRSVVGGDAMGDAGELVRLRGQLEENERALEDMGSRSEALGRQLDSMCEVFADAGQRIHISPRRLRLSRMNVVLAEQSPEEAHDLDLAIARVPGDPPRERAVALVRVFRSDVPQPRNLLDDAARLL
jgi:hypothetical protein